MTKIRIIFIVILTLLVFTRCYDRDIIERKGLDHFLPEIESLSYTQDENLIILSWEIPDNIPEDFNRPLESVIQVVENDIYKQKISVIKEGNSAEIIIDTNKEYRFIVRLLGVLTNEAKEEGYTDRVFSKGVMIEV